MKGERGRLWFTVLLLLLAGVFLYASGGVYVQTQLVATRISLLTMLFLGLQLALDLRPDWAQRVARRGWFRWARGWDGQSTGTDPAASTAELRMLLWVGALVGLIAGLGIAPGVSLFLAAALVLFSRLAWHVALASGAGLWALLHWGLYGALGIRAYDGYLWRLL